MPTLFNTTPQLLQSGARLGETVTVDGIRLAGSGHVLRLTHRLVPTPLTITPSAPDAAGTKLSFVLPNAAGDQVALAPGLWSLSLRFTPVDELDPRDTNAVPLVLAPNPAITADLVLPLPAATATRGGVPRRVTVTLHSRPQVRLEQRATLLLDGIESAALPRAAPAQALTFEFPDSLAAGNHWLRLRVDGTDSVLLDRSGPAPAFDATQQISVPP